MSVKQRLFVAWIAILANVAVLEVAHTHHREIMGGVLTGITCVLVGWWL
jgi:hypothetical protein